MDLTKRQLAVLQHIRKFLETEGRSPTLKEIADGVGSSAVSTIHKHVQHLIDKGFLDRSHGKGNNIVLSQDDEPRPVPAGGGWVDAETQAGPLGAVLRRRGRRARRSCPNPGPSPWKCPPASTGSGRSCSCCGCGAIPWWRIPSWTAT